jgi:hypothetical protein
MKASTEAGSLGGSQLNLKGMGQEMDGTSRSTGGDEVASGTDCTVVSGTRLTPSKSSASVLASSVRLELACCGETTLVFVSDARSTPDVSPAERRRVDLLDSRRGAASCLAMPASPPPPLVGKVTGQTRMLLFRHVGKTSSIPPPAGGLTAAIVVVARRRKEYHVVAAVEGHELKTPETDHRPGLKRLLETTHLELDGKLFVNTQQAPTWRANCRRFDPGGSLDRRVNCRRVSQPRRVGARRSTKGGRTTKGKHAAFVLPCAQVGCACSRGLQASARESEREGETVRQPVLPRGQPSRTRALDLPFIDVRRGPRCTMGV